MGRQFSYYCFPEDLTVLEAEVLRPAGALLVLLGSTPAGCVATQVDSYALPLERMGTERLGLHAYLPPPNGRPQAQQFALPDRQFRTIETDRCFIKDNRIRSGRFWYSTGRYGGDEWRTSPDDFMKSAQMIFRKAKRLLQRRECQIHGHKSMRWFGETAWRHYSAGNLELI